MNITLRLVDNYEVRNEILALLQKHSITWFDAALTRAPTELQATLQVNAEHRERLASLNGFLCRNIWLSLKSLLPTKQRNWEHLWPRTLQERSAQTNGTLVGSTRICIGHLYRYSPLSIGSLSAISIGKPDRTKALASQISLTSYFSGEVAGLRLSRRTGEIFAG